MDSDPSGQPKAPRRDQRPWVARVGRRLQPSAVAEPEADVQGLTELAEKASDAARESARHAAGAAHAASLASLTVDRLGSAPIEQARATAREIAGSADLAGGSSAEARDRAALVEHAVQIEVDREPEQPARRAANDHPQSEDPAKPREER